MALWQFDLLLTPRDAGGPVLSDDGWIAQPVPPDVATEVMRWLQQRLGQPWKMMENWSVFGAEKGNRVDVLTNEDGSAEITVRVNAHPEAADFCELACDLAGVAKCQVFGLEKAAVLEATPANLRDELARSKATAFVRDPGGYIRRVANEG
jgi:hypothetical protein